MGAGVQRWWRDGRFEAEVEQHLGATGPRVVARYTTAGGTRVQVLRYPDGRLCTIMYAPGSISYCDGIV